MNLLVAVGTAILGFGLSFSTAAMSIGMALLAIALVMALVLRPREILETKPWREPVMAVGLALFAYIALRTVGQDGLAAAGRLSQYQELVLAPLLMALWTLPLHRRIFFRAFIAGCVLVTIVAWATLPVEAWRINVQTHRISASFALAIAAYLLVVRSPSGPRRWPSLACALLFAVTVLFAIDARTGQLVLVLLGAVAAWQRVPPRWRILATLGMPAVLAGIALLSPAVQGRIVEMQAARHSTAVPDEADSTGVRLQLIRITAETVREHWLGGVGYANYAKAHEQAAQKVYANEPDRDAYLRGFYSHIGNPHDEYALQLVAGGIVGLVLFAAWLGAAGWQARRVPALAGAVIAFAVGCIFNSLLLDFTEAHLYAALLAWMLADARDARANECVGRIAVIATRQIGDVLLATPLIAAARERWPDARIDVIGFAGTLGMLRGNRDVNELVESPKPWMIWRRYDIALVTDIGDRAHLLGWAAALHRTGVIPESNSSNWWKRMLLDHVVVAAGDRGDKHVALEKIDLLAPWPAPSPAQTPRVQAPEGRDLPADIASQLKDGFVVVHAPSMWSYKQWPVAHFEQLVRELVAQGRQVVLTGSESERDRECIAPLRKIEGTVDGSGKLDFNQLVTLFKRAALYIGPDTSVSHLAAASGVPVIAIFGPTNPVRWAPRPATGDAVFAARGPIQQSGNVTLLQSELHCVPCGRAGCEDHRQSRSDCLVDIGPERVVREAMRILALRQG
ncbi:MAG TPA: glycosyltransferase family 9 protein [Ramlibacter sp.]|nr:glycosyltransferase family 9 protein [Ramlibacter sp.]